MMMTTMMVIHSIPWLFIYLESLLLLLFLFAIHLNAPFFCVVFVTAEFYVRDKFHRYHCFEARYNLACIVFLLSLEVGKFFPYCVPLFVCVSMCVSELYLQKCKLVLLELCWVSP